MAGPYAYHQEGAPGAVSATAITPSDSTEISPPLNDIYVGTAGDLVVILANDTAAVTIKNAGVGYHPLRARKVMAATTAANLVGIYV